MPKITYIDRVGVALSVDVKPGLSLMEGAVRNNVPGIEGECGGACACATCHVYIDPDWKDRVGPQSAMEASLLEFADDVRENSRLSCQITVSQALDGLTVHVA